jgi:RHS repeat-associated protein
MNSYFKPVLTLVITSRKVWLGALASFLFAFLSPTPVPAIGLEYAWVAFCNFSVQHGTIHLRASGTAPDGTYTLIGWDGSGNVSPSTFTVSGGVVTGDIRTIACESGVFSDGTPANSTITWAVSNHPDWTVNTHIVTIVTGVCPSQSLPDVEETVFLPLGGSATPTPTPIPTATPGADTTSNSNKVGGNECGDSMPPMARYSVHSMLVSLNIEDRPLRYTPPYGPPIDFVVTYNQKESQQPGTFSYSNLGPKWTFNWLSYVTDDPNSQLPEIGLYRSGGGAEVFAYDTVSQSFVPDAKSHATLVKTTGANGTVRYERRLPDGSKEVFDKVSGSSYPRRIFMTQVIDAIGNIVEIGYDDHFRVTTISDALGQVTTLSYDLPGQMYKITKVTDPFIDPVTFAQRSATFEYFEGKLKTITDEIGIQSRFEYATGTDFITKLTTPYGPTTFAAGEDGTTRWIEITDPELGKERVEFTDHAGIGNSDPAPPNATGINNANLGVANTFFWNKKAMHDAPGIYTAARITHWLLSADGAPSDIVSSEKEPLENRVWYTYGGQSDYEHAGTSANPLQVARVLADGNTQLSQFDYNDLGKVTKSIDPIGRVVRYVFDTNQIDLLEIRQQTGVNNELLRKFTYDPVNEPAHLPVTDTDAAGQPTVYHYTPQGQILTRKNAKDEITTYTYGGTAPTGYLESVSSPQFNGQSAVTTFGYDPLRRVRTITNVADNYSTTTDYDNLDRKTKITYPDTTFEQFQYTDNGTGAMTLDLTGNRDRRGLWTYRHYNGNQQMDSIKDPENRITLYGWCTCGSLTSITDANTNVTTFHRDIQSRVYEKVFHDNTKITYLYEGQSAPNTGGATSRLKSSTDAKNQQTNYAYNRDNTVYQISYSNALISTPTVTYGYDPNYNRMTSMITDGIGAIDYTYYPVAVGTLGAGELQTTSGPLPNSTITLGYDALGRVTSQDIDGAPASVTYDSLGRLGTSTNVLTPNPQSPFTRIYDGVTPRLLTLNYPNGQVTNYSYFDSLHDRRLQTIHNVFGTPAGHTSNLSQHDYTYDVSGQILTWNKTLGASATGSSFGYDNADQLTSVSQGRTHFTYEYDLAGNKLVDAFSITGHINVNGGNTYTANGLNELDTVTRNPGLGPASGPFPITYDANGNMTDDGGNRTFEWDAANRLVAINYKNAGSRTEFVYDGLSRRVKIFEYDGSTASTVEPGGGKYEMFTVGPFVGPAGNYTLLLQGLNANGGQNAMLLDDVTIDGVSVTNGSFETPTVADYQYRPGGAAWTFGNFAGIATNGGMFVGGDEAPDGVQTAFIQGNGTLRQTFALSSGVHTFSFQGTQAVSVNESSQQVQVTLLGLPTSAKTFVWSGNTIAEERDASGTTVTKRFFAEGEQRVGASDAGNYYYSRDHLGSVREVTNATGAVKAQYDYDAWGKQVVVTGNMSFDFGFTGHYRHAASNLYVTLYRAYDPALGRWISRDPIGESGGINLYGYVLNNSTNWIDPLGLDVFVGEHPGVINNSHNPLNHAAIILRPNNPADFADNPLFAATGGKEATLGGQAFGGPWTAFIGSPYGNLRSAPNYPADAPATLSNITPVNCPSGKSDSEFINDLIRAATSYRNDQPYNPFGLNGTYNSNSYVSGVLTAAGAVPPVFGGVKPAYGNPLPLPSR